MNIVLGGRATHQIEDAVFSVSPGDVFVIPPMVTHAYYDTHSLAVYHILFKKDFIRTNRDESQSMPGFTQLMEIEPFLRQNFSKSTFLHLTHKQLSDIELDINILDDSGEYNAKAFSPLRYHTAWKLLYNLANLLYMQTHGEPKSLTARYQQQILDTLEYIHKHYSEKITVELLSERLYLSRSTFLRNFRKVCDTSPVQYLNVYRVRRAKEMLGDGILSKTEIAQSCGFYDLSHMEKMLKKENV
jgi:AraC-like DNA-binding protein